MPEKNVTTSDKNPESNDGLALIVGGLFVLALVFATYSYFNKSNDTTSLKNDEQKISDKSAKDDQSTLGDKLRDLFSDNEKQGDLNGNGASTEEEDTEIPEVAGKDTEKVLYSGENVFAQWLPTDYQQGDITGNSYVVKTGDTLWEIAEAKYGNGSDWTNILAANSSSIGYLPSGEQALIVSGQAIVLP